MKHFDLLSVLVAACIALCSLSPAVTAGQTNAKIESAAMDWIAKAPESFRAQYAEVRPVAFFTNSVAAVVVVLATDLENNTGLCGQCFVREDGRWKTSLRAQPNFLRKACGLTEEQIESLADPVEQFNAFMKYRRPPSGITIVPATGSLAGSWHNGRDGFYTRTLSFRSDGEGMLGVAVGRVPFQWQTNAKHEVVLVVTDGQMTTNQLALFEVEKDVIVLQTEGKEEPFWRVSTNEPPSLKTYFEELAKGRRRIQAREEQKRKREEKLAGEKPEYERIRKSIIENPHVVVSSEFYVREDTPATRALKSTLGDFSVEYPENALMDLLKSLPPDNHWIRKQIFARPELTAGTIEHYYPEALDWGLHLNHGILANIAQHPNTPWELVEDLATRTDMPGGAVGPAQEQIKKYADDVVSGRIDSSPEEFRHLYALALKLPKTGHTKRGEKIILVLAKSASTPTDMLVEIAQTDDQLVQRAIVSNTNTPSSVLTQLSKSAFPRVRAAVGSHPDLSVDELLVLLGDKDGSVRAAVAAHPATPPSKLVEMQSDEYFDVRRNLIRNPHTPTSVLEKLAADKYTIIKSEARSALRERQMQKQ